MLTISTATFLSSRSKGPLWDFLNLATTKQEIAQAVMPIYVSWQQDESGYDEEVGYGGICNMVADAIADVLFKHQISCKTYSAEEDHTAVIAATKTECYGIDVHWTHYEICKGLYCYTKIKDVEITPELVSVHPEYREMLQDEYTDELPEEWQEEPEE